MRLYQLSHVVPRQRFPVNAIDDFLRRLWHPLLQQTINLFPFPYIILLRKTGVAENTNKTSAIKIIYFIPDLTGLAGNFWYSFVSTDKQRGYFLRNRKCGY